MWISGLFRFTIFGMLVGLTDPRSAGHPASGRQSRWVADMNNRFWRGVSRIIGGKIPPRSIAPPILCGALAGLDAVMLTSTGYLSLTAYGDRFYLAQEWPRYLALSLAGAIGTVILAQLCKLYSADVLSTPFLRPWNAMMCWLVTLIGLLAAIFFVHFDDRISRVWVGLWFLSGAACLGLVRLALRAKIAWWRSNGWMRQAVVVVGQPAKVAALSLRLQQPGLRDDYRVAGVFHSGADPVGAALPDGPPPPPATMLTAESLVPFVRDQAIETVMVCFGTTLNPLMTPLGRDLLDLPVQVVLCLDDQVSPLPVLQAQQLGSMSLLQISRPPIADWGRIVKGLEDRILGGLILAICAPVMGLAALAIRLDSKGPVLFRQLRFGFNNQAISVLKFRTMHAGLGDLTGASRTVRGDRRVTRVGRFLRASSLDELPQLINVLRGEMSLVGPRAHPVMMKVDGRLYHEAVDGYVGRHRVKPGITGLAQINGCRGEVDSMEKAQARLRYDLEYASRASLWLDIKILLLTPIKAMLKVY